MPVLDFDIDEWTKNETLRLDNLLDDAALLAAHAEVFAAAMEDEKKKRRKDAGV
ncbi:MAG TPA: hypothetical protein VMP01_09365 [Pirellulaceae bacterium]|nr:hypothetical protein [Pirellulaceae bacterium]